MSWFSEVQEIHRRREMARAQGGEEGVRRQHEKGRLTIRERIDILVDEGSFAEHGQNTGAPEYDDDGNFIGFTPANYVFGFASVEGRPIAVGGEDFTIKGGSPNPAGLRKSVYAEHAALQYRLPLVRMLEGGGGSVGAPRKKGQPAPAGGNGVFAEPRFQVIAKAMSQVPVVSAAVGPVAGFPAGRLVASHFSVMVKETSQVLVAGPAVVERALNRSMSKEELGGWRVHTRSGIVDNVADTEAEALAMVRRFLSYLPSNVHELSPRIDCDDPADRAEQALLDIVPRDRNQPFDMRRIIELVMDEGSVFEIAPDFGRGQIVCLARLRGQTVGILANDCTHYAGAMTAQGGQKTRRFIEFFDTFHIPIINFVDEPGFMIGPDAEKEGTIRYGMAAVSAAACSVVPWASICVHKSFGVASAAHFGPGGYVLAWPSAESGALPVEGGVAVMYQRQIAAAEDPDKFRREIEQKIAGNRNPLPRAETFGVHELIDPRDTRRYLADWIEWIQPRLATLPGEVTFGMRP